MKQTFFGKIPLSPQAKRHIERVKTLTFCNIPNIQLIAANMVISHFPYSFDKNLKNRIYSKLQEQVKKGSIKTNNGRMSILQKEPHKFMQALEWLGD